MKVAAEQLNGLTHHISDEELARAKNIIKMDIALGLENQEDRLEEIARDYMTNGKLTFNDIDAQLDAVTSDDINRAASNLLRNSPTLLVTGGAINLVPAVSDVQRMLS